MNHWPLFLAIIILAGCSDDPGPATEPTITIEDELLGNWEYQRAELYPAGSSVSTVTWTRSATCEQSTDKLGWLIRQMDVRIPTDKKFLTLIMTECLEKTNEYTHLVSWSDYSLAVVDSSIQRPVGGGNPIVPFTWRIREVEPSKLVMWRNAPEEATQLGVAGARMLYTFKRN